MNAELKKMPPLKLKSPLQRHVPKEITDIIYDALAIPPPWRYTCHSYQFP